MRILAFCYFGSTYINQGDMIFYGHRKNKPFLPQTNFHRRQIIAFKKTGRPVHSRGKYIFGQKAIFHNEEKI